jgi:hypothetical protein
MKYYDLLRKQDVTQFYLIMLEFGQFDGEVTALTEGAFNLLMPSQLGDYSAANSA